MSKLDFSLRAFKLTPDARGYYSQVHLVQPGKRVYGWPEEMQPKKDLTPCAEFERTRSHMVAIKRAKEEIEKLVTTKTAYSDYTLEIEIWR